ncbi:MAG: rhombosortase [Cellvibrionaceae bacterium]
MNPPPISRQQLFFVVLLGAAVLVYLAGESARALLYYQGVKVQQGEVWRLLSAHLVHSNLNHLLLNTGAFVMATVLFANALSVKTWLTFVVTGGLFICLCYLVLHPPEVYYFGLSALFYGVVVLGSLASFGRDPLIASLALGFVIARLLFAQFAGTSSDMEALIQAPLAESSHLYGAIWGLVFGLGVVGTPAIQNKLKHTN